MAGARIHENDYFRAMQHLGSTRIRRIRFSDHFNQFLMLSMTVATYTLSLLPMVTLFWDPLFFQETKKHYKVPSLVNFKIFFALE